MAGGRTRGGRHWLRFFGLFLVLPLFLTLLAWFGLGGLDESRSACAGYQCAIFIGPSCRLVTFFLTVRDSPRVGRMEKYIASAHPPPWFRYYYVNWSSANTTNPPSLVPPKKYRDLLDYALSLNRPWDKVPKSPNLFVNLFFAIDFFLANTEAAWLLRCTDDAIINFGRLPSFLRELERQCDPRREWVALGNCLVAYWRLYPYPQGGAGYLFSRFACEQLGSKAREVLETGSGDEDAIVGALLRGMGHDGQSFTSDAFIGYNFSAEHRPLLRGGRYRELPPCPQSPAGGRLGCRKFVAPLNKVAVWHEHASFDEAYVALAMGVFNAPDEVMWWMVNFAPHVCYRWRPS